MAGSADSKFEVLRDLAPKGTLRVAVNFGNPVLVQTAPDGSPKGIVPALARELARRLDVALEMLAYKQAGAVFDSIGSDAWDVCFLAIEPKRADLISFTAPYVTIEGTYLTPSSTSWATIADADRAGHRIGVSEKSAYDLFLSRTLQHATIVRKADAEAVVKAFMAGEIDAIAGVRQPLDALAVRLTHTRVMRDRFMAIEQACGVPVGRGAGHAFLQAFIEDVKRSGFVRRTLDANGQREVAVAALR